MCGNQRTTSGVSSHLALLETRSLCSLLHIQAGWLLILGRFSCGLPILLLGCWEDRHLLPHLPLPGVWVQVFTLVQQAFDPLDDLPRSLTFLCIYFWDLPGMGSQELPGYQHTYILYLNDAIFTNLYTNSAVYFKSSLDYLWPHTACSSSIAQCRE